MRSWTIAHDVPLLGRASSVADISDELIQLGKVMVRTALEPMLFKQFDSCQAGTANRSQDGLYWLRSDVCLQFATHLDVKDMLKSCIASIVPKVQSAVPPHPTVYAVALSFSHIVIATITLSSTGSPRVYHTPALQFLPLFFATEPSTPGISALVALSMVLDNSHILPPSPTTPILKQRLPVEVWHQVASNLSSPPDIQALAVLSAEAYHAASDMLRYPHIASNRILKPTTDPVDPLWVSPRWCRIIQDDYMPQDGLHTLYSQKFLAFSAEEYPPITETKTPPTNERSATDVEDCIGVSNRSGYGNIFLQVAPGDPPIRPLTRRWSEKNSNAARFVSEGQVDLLPVKDPHKTGWAMKYGISHAC